MPVLTKYPSLQLTQIAGGGKLANTEFLLDDGVIDNSVLLHL
jgi:hypothetical protein